MGGVLVSHQGIEPMPPVVEVWSPIYWSAREAPQCLCALVFQ